MCTKHGVSLLARLRALTDVSDLHFYGGLVLAAVGGSLISVAWTLVAVGFVLMLVGYMSSR